MAARAAWPLAAGALLVAACTEDLPAAPPRAAADEDAALSDAAEMLDERPASGAAIDKDRNY